MGFQLEGPWRLNLERWQLINSRPSLLSCAPTSAPQAWFLKTRNQHLQAKAVHLEARDMRATVLGDRHLEVALSLQQAAISMAVSLAVPKWQEMVPRLGMRFLDK